MSPGASLVCWQEFDRYEYQPCSSGKHNGSNTELWHECIAPEKPKIRVISVTKCMDGNGGTSTGGTVTGDWEEYYGQVPGGGSSPGGGTPGTGSPGTGSPGDDNEPVDEIDGVVTEPLLPGPGNWTDPYAPGGAYWNSPEYLNKVMSTLEVIDFQNDPGIKNYNEMNATQKFLHILRHLKKAKEEGTNFRITDIMTNVPTVAPAGPFNFAGGWYESGHAAVKINGKSYMIGYVFGLKSGYNYINAKVVPEFHDASHKGQVNYYYKDVNYPGRSAFEVYLPLELRNWFETIYY